MKPLSPFRTRYPPRATEADDFRSNSARSWRTHYTRWYPVLVSVSASNDQRTETPYLLAVKQIVVMICSDEILRIMLVAY